MKNIYPREHWGTIAMHIPVGLAAIFLASLGLISSNLLWIGIFAAGALTLAFLTYEVVELVKINLDKGWSVAKDNGYPELAGFCHGLFIGGLILLALVGLQGGL